VQIGCKNQQKKECFMKLREKYNNVIICKSDVIVAFDFLFFYGFVPALGTKNRKITLLVR
jgi:hypothetical protein